MLQAYITATQNLLQQPGSGASTLYPTASLVTFINTARGQLAIDGECIRPTPRPTLTTTPGGRYYSFSQITFATAASVSGISITGNIRQISYGVASGEQWMRPRAFEWFTTYRLNNPVPQQNVPNEWSQLSQGILGTIWLDPVPDQVYVLNLDAVCYPNSLALDSDVEAIPYPFTDAVPFFAAYYAMLSAQSGVRQSDADRMFERYKQFLERARRFSNPTVQPYIYPQSANPSRSNQLGIQPARGAGGAGG